MDNTNENETPLFGKKPEAEPVATPIFATPTAGSEPTTPAAPATPSPKKTSVGLIIGAIITGIALIAAVVILVIVLINRTPSSSSQKADDSSKGEEKPLKKLDDDKPKNTDDDDDDKPKDINDDDDDDDGEPKNTDDDDDGEPTNNNDDNQTGFTVSIQDKSFKFSNNYVGSIKNALNAGYTMKYYDADYKAHDLTKDTLADYLAIETKYGSTNASIIDANGDDVIDIYGTKDYSLKGDQASNKVSAAKFEKLYYHSTLPLTLPGNNKISCYNTTKKDVVKMYGDAKESSVGIVHYHKDGLDLAFHFDSQGTVSALFIRID